MKNKLWRIGFGLMMSGLIFSLFGFNGKTANFEGVKEKENLIVQKTNEYSTDPDLVASDLTCFIPTIANTDNSTAISLRITRDSTNLTSNYMIGYFGTEEDNENYPCKVQYTLKDSKGNKRIAETEVNFNDQINKYYGIGAKLGVNERNLTCDIVRGVDETLDLEEKIYLLNVFTYNPGEDLNEGGDRKPNFSNRYKFEATVGKSLENLKPDVYELNDYAVFEYSGVTKFNGFSSFKVDVIENNTVETYKNGSKRSEYNKYVDDIKSGKMYVRSRFGFGADTRYIVDYEDGTRQVLSDLANNIDISEAGSSLYLLLGKTNYKKVTNIAIKGAIIYVDIYNKEIYKKVARTDYYIRFGVIEFKYADLLNKDQTVAIKKQDKYIAFDGDLFIIISILVLIVGYMGTSLGIYFYQKKKYENDEFKKMNTRQYFKNNLLGLACVGSILLFIEFTVLRFGFLNNSLPVYNPSDVYVIVFGVAGIILCGYFIRYFYLLAKARKERIRNEKLKLALDKNDDGTLLVKK